MAIVNPISDLGASQFSGSEIGLFLKVFSGEVLDAYENATKMLPLVTTRRISSGW